MEREPITLGLYRELQGYFDRLGAPLSEYNFSNLFLFRDKHEYVYLRGEKRILGKAGDGTVFSMPLVYPFDSKGLMFPIPDEWAEGFPEKSFLEAESDYLFKRETLAELPGRKRASRRNLLYQFENEHPYVEVISLEEGEIPLALSLLENWEAGHDGKDDRESCREALSMMEALDLEGILVKEGDRPLGFAIFSPLNQETLLVHFAKSLSTIKGGHVFLIQRLAKATSYPWINLEQDLGLQGLRQEKQAFGPDRLQRKWRITSK